MGRGLRISWSLNRFLLCFWIASFLRLGMHCASFFQSKFVARQITGATRSLLPTLVVEVFLSIVGATCIRAASTVVLV